MPDKKRRSVKINKIICDQCKLQIKEEEDEYIECDKCAKRMHSQCTKLDKRQLDYLMSNESELYTCHFCDGGENDVKSDLVDIKTKLGKLDQLKSIQESIQFMSTQYDEILKGVVENRKRLTLVEKENSILKKEIKELKTSMKFLNDNRVKNDCIIRGLNATEGSSAVDSVLDLARNVGVEMQPEKIEEAYFLRNNKSSGAKKTVVVKFCNKSAKDNIMAIKPKLKENPATSEVFVNDYLSRETMLLFNYAKTLKNVGYRHIFVRNGKVQYKRSDISRPQVIRSAEDVDELLMKAATTKTFRRSRGVNEQVSAHDNDPSSEDEDNQLNFASPNPN